MEIHKIANFVKFMDHSGFEILSFVYHFHKKKEKKTKSKFFSKPNWIICSTRVTEAPKNPVFQKI